VDERAFEVRKLFYAESLRMLTAYCVKGIQMLFLASIGAGAAMLIFMLKLDTFGQTPLAFAFFMPLVMFFLSALLASGVLCLSYLSQFFHTRRAFSFRVSVLGIFFQALAILSAIAAYGVCLYGTYRVYLIFMSI
jgi:hypothetical protein